MSCDAQSPLSAPTNATSDITVFALLPSLTRYVP
uniref:Uncharacterized protein n=1 Tax=Musa acuminata subsp. malaccensis TaxID=214687 RepID=A0A804KG94_MUSAM